MLEEEAAPLQGAEAGGAWEASVWPRLEDGKGRSWPAETLA